MIPGIGTVVNVATVLLGATLGVLLGNRLPTRTRDVVTDAIGPGDPADRRHLGDGGARTTTCATRSATGAPMLIVLGSLLIGGIVGSLLRLEARVESLGGWLQTRLSGDTGSAERHRFIEGFVISSLVFCTGPLTILGSLNDGLGNGAEQLYLKAALDGFAAIAFAASFGWGVAASAVTVLVVQGALTLLGLALGDVLPDAQLAAITATGGLLLVGVALRLLRVREIPVADLLPGAAVAPTSGPVRGRASLT